MINTTLSKEIIKFLRKHQNKKISHSLLDRKFFKSSQRKKILILQTLKETLKILEKENLIQVEKNQIYINKDFILKGIIIFNSKGDGFVKLNSGNESFIFTEDTKGSFEGDEVAIIPQAVGRKNKLESKVVEIVKRNRLYFRFLVEEVAEFRYATGCFLDINSKIEGFLDFKKLPKKIKIQTQDILIIQIDKLLSPAFYEVFFTNFEKQLKHKDTDLFRVSIKYNYNLKYPDYNLKYKNQINKKIVEDWEQRKNLRDLYTVTIDGEDSKDFDDAISFENDTIYVHIADVSYYVKKDSPLDKEAYKRSTSCYLGSNVLPMLPKILSENLCSLIHGKNRLSFTVEIKIDQDGNIYQGNFYKSIIKVDKRYTYKKAEEHIKNGKNKVLSELMNIGHLLKERRIKQGKIDLNLPEKSIAYDSSLNVISVAMTERLQSHILIEELMLSANTQVAQFIQQNKYPFLYRIHEKMNEQKLEILNEFLESNGFKEMKTLDSIEIQKVLNRVFQTKIESVFNILLLRSFSQACYSNQSIEHWGLGFKHYCHFTSPIRRYPDLVCHRILEQLLKKEKNPYSKQELQELGIYTSQQERKAVSAERDYSKIKLCKYLQKSQEINFIGTISGFTSRFVYVDIDIFFVEGILSAGEFSFNNDIFVKSDFKFYSKKFSRYFAIGDRLEVSLDRIDLESIKIYLKLKK